MKPWAQLTETERAGVRRNMRLCGGKSVNGVAGWYQQQRLLDQQDKPVAQPIKPPITHRRKSLWDAELEPLRLDEIADVLPR